MPDSPAFEVPIYVARVEIHDDAFAQPVRYPLHRFGPIPAATVEWNDGRCRTVNLGCTAPAFVVRVPAGSGAERVGTVSTGDVHQEWLRWPGGRKADDWDAQKVLHAAWMGQRSLSVDLAPGSSWTEPEVRAWPDHGRGGLNAPPAVVQDGVGEGVQAGAHVEAHEPAPVEVPATPKPPAAVRKRLVIQECGPPPVGPQPKLSQMSLFGEPEAAGVGR